MFHWRKINHVLQENFLKEPYKLIQCENILTDVESQDDQIEIINNYNLGKTNDPDILENYLKLKRKFYWPKMHSDIQIFINNWEICKLNEYEGNPYQLNNNFIKISKFSSDRVQMDTLTLKNEKYLTIIDSYSAFAQIYNIKTLSALEIAENLLKYFSYYQITHEIIHDSGPEFKNTLIKGLWKIY